MEDIELCRLFDGKLSCRLGDEEFYILPTKQECTLEDLKQAFSAFIDRFDDHKDKIVAEAIEEELGKRKEELLEW